MISSETPDLLKGEGPPGMLAAERVFLLVNIIIVVDAFLPGQRFRGWRSLRERENSGAEVEHDEREKQAVNRTLDFFGTMV
jgi:hypothetical protein